METRVHTLTNRLSFASPSVILPKYGIIDAIILKVKLTISNTGSSQATPTIKDVLKTITDISVKSDSNVTHYQLNALDVAIMNAYEGQFGANATLNKTLTAIGAGASGIVEFPLFLNKGDIFAANHQDVTLSCVIQQTPFVTGLTVTAVDIAVGIVELVKLTEADVTARYGEKLQLLNEPKVTTRTRKCPANSELTPFMELPTGSVIQEGYFTFSGAPTNFGIVDVAGELSEKMNIDWEMHRALDAYRHNVAGNPPENTIRVDFGNELEANSLGLMGWSYMLGDMMVASKNDAELSCRAITVETMVNHAAFEQFAAAFKLESGAGI